MSEEIKKMLDELKELENAKTEAEVTMHFGNICGATGEAFGKYDNAVTTRGIVIPEMKKIVDAAYKDIKHGDKNAIVYIEAAEKVLNETNNQAKELGIESKKAIDIHERAKIIKNRKLQEFKISN